MKILAVFICYSLICCSQTDAQYTFADFKPLHQLAGTWKMTTTKGYLVEEWFKKNDSLMHNKSYGVNGMDTIPEERVELKIVSGIITYTSTVANQNNGKAVVFTLADISGGNYIFENRKHDFPQKISYRFVDNNSLAASISGTITNEHRLIPFNFKRQ